MDAWQTDASVPSTGWSLQGIAAVWKNRLMYCLSGSANETVTCRAAMV